MTEDQRLKRNARRRARYAADPQAAAKVKVRADRNRASVRESQRNYGQRNREKLSRDHAAWVEQNPEREREIWERSMAKRLPHRMLAKMRSSGKKKGVPVTITAVELAELIRPMVCAVTGMSLTYDGPSRNNPWAPSPDRIIPSLGYVPGNVRIVSWLYNRAKGADTDNDVLEMALAMVAQSARSNAN